jgi:hypothetical protein
MVRVSQTVCGGREEYPNAGVARAPWVVLTTFVERSGLVLNLGYAYRQFVV